jgi:hypothetical protein
MDKIRSGRFLLIITIAIYVAFGLVKSVIGVIIDKFQLQYRALINIMEQFQVSFALLSSVVL